jgi:hypothetical protein
VNEKNCAPEVAFDWSPLCVSVALLTLMVLSLAVGLWFDSRDWTDLATIQMTCGIASYVVTTASCKDKRTKTNPNQTNSRQLYVGKNWLTLARYA